jgi:superfamily II DNA/RNA helicase
MMHVAKSQEEILSKLNIAQLNDMQLAMQDSVAKGGDTVLLSPTGSGKTLAFLLPILKLLDAQSSEIQTLILTPSRELAIQIEQVLREMGTGFKTNAIYGGRAGSKDKIDLKHAPTILIGTPGRIADHFRRETISGEFIKILVLDEFDKSLEIGFEEEMKEIMSYLPSVNQKILTSATQKREVPEFVNLNAASKLNFLSEEESLLKVKLIKCREEEKLFTLLHLLGEVGDANGIIFCNFKETIEKVSLFLEEKHVAHGNFFGGLEQKDRERALIMFRNGTYKLLLATDLAARGIDVPELDFIIHFELPGREEEFTHRNGRTARMHSSGSAYIIQSNKQRLQDYAKVDEEITLTGNTHPVPSSTETLYVSGGRKDKISKGDIAGLFFKQGGLDKTELGRIELMQDCTFVAVPLEKADDLVEKLNNSRLKKKKVRISILD